MKKGRPPIKVKRPLAYTLLNFIYKASLPLLCHILLVSQCYLSITEWMDDVQFGHRLRQILNLLFFILFGKQLLGVNGFEHPLQFSVNQVWRVEHRVALADLLLADVPCKRVHILKKEAVNPK